MAATIKSATLDSSNPPAKRSRRTHRKVKTGCLTCKIRRKKCDEERPACFLCTSTGRKCDGYVADLSCPTPPEVEAQVDITTSNPYGPQAALLTPDATPPSPGHPDALALERVVFSTSMLSLQSEVEFYCFDFFCRRTSPTLGGYFDSRIWTDFILRACLHNDAVLQVAAAVGAVHRRYELGITPEAFQFCAYADNLYAKALRTFQIEMLQGNSEVMVCTLLLLGIREIFQDDIDNAVMYTAAAFRTMLNRVTRTVHQHSQPLDLELNQVNLKRLFSSLEFKASYMFGSLPKPLPRSIAPIPIPSCFTKLEEARDVLFHEVKTIWRLPELDGNDEAQSHMLQGKHIERLLQWSAAYAEYSKTYPCNLNSSTLRKAKLLKWYREAAYLLLLSQTQPTFARGLQPPPMDSIESCPHRFCRANESMAKCEIHGPRQAALDAHFARLSLLINDLDDSSLSSLTSHPHTLSIDSTLSPLFDLGTSNCKSTKVRHQVAAILHDRSVEEKNGFRETIGIYPILEKLASLESLALEACNPLQNHAVDAKWVDITWFVDEKKVLLRYCTDDKTGKGTGLRWKEEELEFL